MLHKKKPIFVSGVCFLVMDDLSPRVHPGQRLIRVVALAVLHVFNLRFNDGSHLSWKPWKFIAFFPT